MLSLKRPEFDTRKLFGRKKGRQISQQAQFLLETLFPKLNIKNIIDQNLKDHIDPKTFFNKHVSEINFEIGFGDGDMIALLSNQHPDKGYIGCEPFLNGVTNLLCQIEHQNHDNVRLWQDDALVLLSKLQNNSLDNLFILNPDPWPKKRHHKRRIVRSETLNLYAHVLKPGAKLIMTTDVSDLAEWMCTQTTNHPDFVWTAKSQKDWTEMPKDWQQTKYEKKGIQAGRQQYYLIFKRK